jgi:hypothetical protein
VNREKADTRKCYQTVNQLRQAGGQADWLIDWLVGLAAG